VTRPQVAVGSSRVRPHACVCGRGRAVDEVEDLAGLDKVDVSDREVKMAEMLVESLTAEFHLDKYHDDYRI
jgi:non-homologous end joining protein Ku